MPTTRQLARIYREAHNIMRNVDGLQPQESFDELLKYLFFKQNYEVMVSGDRIVSVDLVRRLFSEYLSKANVWSSEIWREKEIFLSDACLSDVHDLLFPIVFSSIDYDVRSHALKEFLTPDIRKGLGIFLTPDAVIAAMIDFMPNSENLKVLDPACGSGTFLIEYLKKLKPKRNVKVFGVDKSPRMLLLADLNLGHIPNVTFVKKLADSLKAEDLDEKYDVILTNPPFGVSLDARDYDFGTYRTCKNARGRALKKQTSEIVFIERCLQNLKPGGTLGIVIPRSIATNNRLQAARAALSAYGYVYAVMGLPPETFASTGTYTTTIVLFAKTYKNQKEKTEPLKLALASIDNVGFDSTGRFRDGSRLPYFAKVMDAAIARGASRQFVEMVSYREKKETFARLSDVFIAKPKNKGDLHLGDVCQFIGIGRTPARSAYSESGNFLIKVGNLTGSGINWEARDRNFISDQEAARRLKAKKPLILQPGDILLTSSAHSPVYIAKKSDMFTGIPKFIKTKYVSFVGEVMLVRANPDKIDPYLLLAFFRANETVAAIQKMVRGQTAHLHANDLSQLVIPKTVFRQGSRFEKAAKVIRKQNELNELMGGLAAEQARLLNTTAG